jgi:hypothetical protein
MDRELRKSIALGDIPRVKLLIQGGASITGQGGQYVPALHQAALCGKTFIIEWLLVEGGSHILDVDDHGYTALLYALKYMYLTVRNVKSIHWLLELGGANITDATPDGHTVWDLLRMAFGDFIVMPLQRNFATVGPLTALLRIMVVQSAPPAHLVVQI